MRLPPIVTRPLVVAAALLAFAALVLLPGLGGPGLWEPQEMAIADEAAARADGKYAAPAAPCESATSGDRGDEPTPDPRGARTLTPRLAAFGLSVVASSDAGLRVPMALLGLLGVLAVFGVGWRLGSTRAGAIAGLVLTSFPLWSLQARQLGGELPGAVGGTLLIYGLVALATPRRTSPGGAVPRWQFALDVVGALAALALGAHLAFDGSGALVGLLPPLVAVAIAGGFALPELGVGLRAGWRALDRRRVEPPLPAIDPWRTAAVGLAAIGTIAVAVWIAVQVFELGPLTKETRQLAGKSILTPGCWSTALGGTWHKADHLGSLYNGLFQQAGFGMFPASILVVIALGALVSGVLGERARFAGALVFAWAAATWIAAAVFARKVGPVVWTGFPAGAVAIGLFIDALYQRRAEADVDPTVYRRAAWSLVGLAVVLGAVVLGKDLQAFPERLTSLVYGSVDAVKYPAQARLLGAPVKSWALVLGALAALAFALELWLWRPRRTDGAAPDLVERAQLAPLARYAGIAALVLLAALALFWTHGWHRALSRNLSSKHIFSVYRELRRPGDTLGIMGQMGNAPRYYAGGPYETLEGREALLSFLRRPSRVFAMAPASELCAIHKAKATGLAFYVLDDSNPRTLLLSNQVTGGRDHNPIATSILREPPADLGTPVSATYDNAIELIGVKMPTRVGRGDDFTMTLYYKVLRPIGGNWKVFVHFDGAQRFNGDHQPIRERCPTSDWQAGDYIVDTFKVSAGNVSFARGSYTVYTGFFTGSNPNWRNMPVTAGTKDGNNRIAIGRLILD
ncbi:MAG: hypothetical protein KBG48_17785 [Kofleriaceae bacterium]|nr:hypothetical protein [Kofleriaceae bacterium]MBP9169254.1 hypothetical protein [Kofleriaceae bacterium]MBP9859037.1 hypothetical protein [Kofleriaceae bacterium]